MYTALRKSLNKENDKGFTLIELLVVIIIIGILAAIAIPIFLSQRQKAVDSSVKSDVRQVATNLETYYTDNNAYPAMVDGAPVTGVLTGVRLSPGNAVVFESTGAAAGTFCLIGSNPDASGTFAYDSDQGGLLAKGVACS